jgi:hypothetical protein
MLHYKHLEKQEQANPKTRREVIKIKVEINEIETNKQKIQNISETKSLFF